MYTILAFGTTQAVLIRGCPYFRSVPMSSYSANHCVMYGNMNTLSGTASKIG